MIKTILVTPSPARYPRFMAGLAQPGRAVLQRTGSGEKALLAARTYRPHLVVLDEQVRDLAGPVLVQRLLSLDAAIGVAVISGRAAKDFHEAYEGLGVLAQLPQNPGLAQAHQLLDQVERLQQAMLATQGWRPAQCRTRRRLMEKVLIVGCKRAMDDVCIGCSRCLVGFNRREGNFAAYADQDAEVVGLLSCGDCPGASIVTRLAQVKLWNQPLGERVSKIHIGPCLADHCPHRDTIISKIKAKAGVEVIEGTHPYLPADIFATA